LISGDGGRLLPLDWRENNEESARVKAKSVNDGAHLLVTQR
jgi:hypothetical protein